MRFGIAKEIITPDYPYYMIGFAEYYKKYFERIHDDVFVRCFIMDDGKTRTIMLAYDLLFHDFEFTEKIRAYIKNEYKIDGANVFCSFTHTHYSVAVQGYASELATPEYEQFLWQQTIRCIHKAFINQYSGSLSYAILRTDDNINRRKLVNGKYEMLPNLEGEKDNELFLLLARDENGMIRALVVNYSCHPNICKAEMEISGEYPGRLCQLLETRYFGAQAIFFQGCGADTRARLTAEYDHFRKGTFDDIDDMAKSLEAKIQRAIERSDVMKSLDVCLQGCTFAIDCPLDIHDRQYYENDYNTNPYEALRARAKYILDHYDELPDSCLLHGGVIKITDDLMVVYMGGEICYSTKKLLMEQFPDKKIFFVGYTDSTAYVPSDKIISEGGYEHEGSIVEYTLKGSFCAGIDALMVNAVKDCLSKIDALSKINR